MRLAVFRGRLVFLVSLGFGQRDLASALAMPAFPTSSAVRPGHRSAGPVQRPGVQRCGGAAVGGASGRALEVLLDDLRVHGIDPRGVDPLTTMPRGFPREHVRVELLRYPGL